MIRKQIFFSGHVQGVGICDSYGTAQRMYVKRGYIPDASEKLLPFSDTGSSGSWLHKDALQPMYD